MNKDLGASTIPPEAYVDALNFMEMNSEGDFLDRTNEKGTEEIPGRVKSTEQPDAIFQVIGHLVLNNEVVLWSVSENGTYSEIGVVDRSGNYGSILTTDELNFSLEHDIDAEGRIYFNNDRVVYWSDDFNPPRILNLDSIPTTNIAENTDLFVSQTLPVATFSRVIEQQGSITAGTYQFIPRYLDDTLNPTFFGIITKPIGVNVDFREEGRNSFDGDIQGLPVTKSIEITVSNIDIDFNFLEMVVIVRDGASGTPNAYIIQRKEISGDTDTFVYSGLQGEEEAIDIKEVILERPSYGRAKSVNQIDNRLVLSNLAAASEEGLQELTNKISFRYRVDEIPYQDDSAATILSTGSGDDGTFRLVSVSVQPSTDDDGVASGVDTLIFTFNKDLDASTIGLTSVGLIQIALTGGVLVNTRVSPTEYSVHGNEIHAVFTGADFTDDAVYNFSDYDLIDSTDPDFVILTTWGVGSDLDAISGGPTTDVTIDGGADTYTGTGGAFNSQDTCSIIDTAGVITIDLVSIPTTTSDNIAVYGVTHTTLTQGLIQVLGVDPADDSILEIASTASGAEGAGKPVITNIVNDIVIGAMAQAQDSGVLPNGAYFGDYIDEAKAADGRTYMRDEVYSKSITYVFNSGSLSSPFHIPAKLRTGPQEATKDIPLWVASTAYAAGETATYRGSVYMANTLTTAGDTPEATSKWDYQSGALQEGWLGSYESTETYPTSGEYPSAAGGGFNFSKDGKIRHHKMPSNDLEPFYKADLSGNLFLRRIGLMPVWDDGGTIKTINDLIDSSPLGGRIVGFIIGREIRDSALKRSIAMQGVGQNLWEHKGGNIAAHGNDSQVPYLSNSFFFGKTTIKYTKDRVYPRHDNRSGENGFLSNEHRKDLVQFYSPDVTLLDREIPTGVRVKPVMVIKGTIRQKALCWPNVTRINPYGGLGHLFCSYNGAEEVNSLSTNDEPIIFDAYKARPTTDTKEFAHSQFGDIDLGVANYYNEGYSLLNLGPGNELPQSYTNNADVNYEISVVKSGSNGYNKGRSFTEKSVLSSDTDFISKRNLYNLVYDNERQYGSLDATTYTNAGVFIDRTLIVDPEDSLYYGGDVFLSKYSYKNSGNWRWAVNTRKNPSTSDDNDYKVPYMGSPRLFADQGAQGEEMRSVAYFFVESEVNCNWRQNSFKQEPDGTYTDIGTDYYPNNPKVTGVTTKPVAYGGGSGTKIVVPAEEDFGVLDYSPLLGQASGYNKSYSAQDEIGTQISKPFGFIEVNDYSNRSIYSDQSIEGQAADKYRFFKANNYHDIPRSSGGITNTFVQGNIFYHQTTDSLWRSYVNERTAVPTTEGELILGNGGMFPVPSKELLTIDGGHAGLQNQFAATQTPYGVVWVDQFRGKLFRLAGQDNVEEITNQGMINWFAENIGLSAIEDNPSNPSAKAIIAGYDKRFRRVLITKRDGDDSFTMSFSLLTNSFTSMHSYIPTRYMSVEDKLYAVDNNNFDVDGLRIWEHHKGNYGKFYNEAIAPSTITIAINPMFELEKVFDNIVLLTSSTNSEGIEQLEDTFDLARVHNGEKNTGEVTLVPNLSPLNMDNSLAKVVRRNGEFRMFVPPDAVIDKNNDIFDSANLTLSLPMGDPRKLYRPRMKGKYVVAKFTYLNENNNKFIVDSILSKRGVNAL